MTAVFGLPGIVGVAVMGTQLELQKSVPDGMGVGQYHTSWLLKSMTHVGFAPVGTGKSCMQSGGANVSVTDAVVLAGVREACADCHQEYAELTVAHSGA